MSRQNLNLVFVTIILFLVQVLICNRIVIFHVATPVIFIYPIIRFAFGLNLNLLYTIAFFLGLGIDIFSDTPGMNSLALTILAALKRPILLAYVQRDDEMDSLVPSLSSLGLWGYSKYLFSMVTVYCLLIFSIEFFSFEYIGDIILMAVTSAALSFFILLGVDSLTGPKRGQRL